MTLESHDQSWERQLVAGLGQLPAADFDAWCERHPEALTALTSPKPMALPLPRDRKSVV